MAGEGGFLIHALWMGVWITFLYDILRVLRRVIPHRDVFVSLEDLAFWIYCTLRVFLLLHRESDGTLRWFAVLGALFGMFAYRKLVSPYFVRYTSGLLGKLVRMAGRGIRVLFTPLRFLLRRGKRLLMSLKRNVTGSLSQTKKKLTLRKKFFKIKHRKA